MTVTNDATGLNLTRPPGPSGVGGHAPPLLHPTMDEMITVTKMVVSLQAVVLEVVVLLRGVHLAAVVRLVLVEMTHRR